MALFQQLHLSIEKVATINVCYACEVNRKTIHQQQVLIQGLGSFRLSQGNIPEFIQTQAQYFLLVFQLSR